MTASLSSRTLIRLAFASLLLPAAPASAAPMKYEFSGTITKADASTGLLGTRFHGSFTFDDAKLPSETHVYDRGDNLFYRFGTLDAPVARVDGTGLEVHFADGTSVQTDGLALSSQSIMRPANQDAPAVWTRIWGGDVGAADGTGPDHAAGLYFYGQDRIVSPGQPIPLDITIDDFSDAKLELLGRYIKHPPEWYEIPINMDSPPQLALGTIDSFSIAPVPEPAWTVAALLGAAAWAVRLRRIG
ncbi:MAG: hypothetical protein BGO49_15470 [Planctomycetales bacterium 71-10]|nr:MAG: hypothetical protein BGO49_15470 [Planctomycetales bacterium 71-10]